MINIKIDKMSENEYMYKPLYLVKRSDDEADLFYTINENYKHTCNKCLVEEELGNGIKVLYYK